MENKATILFVLLHKCKVTPPVMGTIPAVMIGFGPVIPGVNVGTGGNISGSTGFNTLGAP